MAHVSSRGSAPALIIGTVMLVLLSACAPSASESATSTPVAEASESASSAPTTVPEAVACDAPEGSVNDVATEPDWREFADYRDWTTADGCLVRIDVIADRPGPEQCGFESARVIVTGVPVGERYTDASDDAEYIRDPEDVFGDPETAAAFDPDAELPAGAESTGFWQGATELWVDRADESAIYLVTGETIERWPLDPEPTGCT